MRLMINMRLARSAFFLPVIFTFYNEDSLHCTVEKHVVLEYFEKCSMKCG